MSEKQPVEGKKIQTYSNWLAFVKGGLVPSRIVCNGYKPMHPADVSCHTNLPMVVDTLARHIPNCGGGFRFSLRRGDSEWPGWREFQEKGIEVHDFRCDVCDEVIPLSAQQIQKHLRPHSGKTRRVRSGGDFNITISPDKPMVDDDNA